MNADAILGWAHDPARPGQRLELDVELDGEQIGTCVADLRRGDLVREGIGDGHHGFRLKLPSSLEPESEHELSVRARSDGTILPLAVDYFASVTGDLAERQLTLRVQTQPDGKHPLDALGDWISPRPTLPRALLGTDGWLFPFDTAERLAEVLGARPPAPERVQAQATKLKARDEHLRSVGIGYLPVAMPSKAAVHGDHLPPGFTVEQEGRPADRLLAALREDPAVEILDLFGALRHARQRGPVFLPQGEDLAWAGAFEASRAVLKELAKRWPGVPQPSASRPTLGDPVQSIDPLRSRERVTLLGDELVAVAVLDASIDQDPQFVGERFKAMYVPLPEELESELGADAALLEQSDAEHLPSAVILDDGSARRLVPFLAEHFARTLVGSTSHFPHGVIERELPLVVIQFLSEDSSFFA